MFALSTQNVPVTNEIAKSAFQSDLGTVVALIVFSGLFASSSMAQPCDAAAIHRAYSVSCDGYSSDELLIRDSLAEYLANKQSEKRNVAKC